jgi:hypothetical protein
VITKSYHTTPIHNQLDIMPSGTVKRMLKRSIHLDDASFLFFFLLLLSCHVVVQSFVLNTSVSCRYHLEATHQNSMILPLRSTTTSITILSAQRRNTEGPQDGTRREKEEENEVESFTARLAKMGMKPVRKEDMRRTALVPPPTPTQRTQRQSYGDSKSKSSSSTARSANLVCSQEILSNWHRMNKIEIGSVQSLDEFLDHVRLSQARKLDDQLLRQEGLEDVAEFESENSNTQENECWE